MKVHELLVKIGFNVRVQSDEESFVGEIENDEGWCLTAIYHSGGIGMQIYFNGLRSILISSLEVKSGEELYFFLSRLSSFKLDFPISYSKLIEYQAEFS